MKTVNHMLLKQDKIQWNSKIKMEETTEDAG